MRIHWSCNLIVVLLLAVMCAVFYVPRLMAALNHIAVAFPLK